MNGSIESGTGRRAAQGIGALAAVAALLLTAAAALAQAPQRQHPERPGVHRAPPPAAQWRGDIRRFHEHDWRLWRDGRWTHGRHDGRIGWWWVVGPTWYFYPAPVYPYPNPYEPPPLELAAPPPAQFWYYCEEYKGYYPYVRTCPGGWKQVPATPPDTPTGTTR